MKNLTKLNQRGRWELVERLHQRYLQGNQHEKTKILDELVVVTPDGRRSIIGYSDGSLKVWELENARPPRTLDGHSEWVCTVAVTPEGRLAVPGSRDNTLKL